MKISIHYPSFLPGEPTYHKRTVKNFRGKSLSDLLRIVVERCPPELKARLPISKLSFRDRASNNLLLPLLPPSDVDMSLEVGDKLCDGAVVEVFFNHVHAASASKKPKSSRTQTNSIVLQERRPSNSNNDSNSPNPASQGITRKPTPSSQDILRWARERACRIEGQTNSSKDWSMNGGISINYDDLRLQTEQNISGCGKSRAMQLALLKRYSEARGYLERCLALSTTPDPEIFFCLGICYSELGDLDSGLSHVRKAIELDPKHQDVELWKRKASDIESKICERGDVDGKALKFEYAGDRLSEAGNFTKARKKYRKAVENLPSAAVYLKLGYTCMQIQKYEEAVEWLEKAVALDPSFMKVDICRVVWAFSLFSLNKTAEAIKHYTDYINLTKSPEASVFKQLAACELQQNEYDKAIQHIEKALELDPDCQNASMWTDLLHKLKAFRYHHNILDDTRMSASLYRKDSWWLIKTCNVDEAITTLSEYRTDERAPECVHILQLIKEKGHLPWYSSTLNIWDEQELLVSISCGHANQVHQFDINGAYECLEGSIFGEQAKKLLKNGAQTVAMVGLGAFARDLVGKVYNGCAIM